MGERAGRRGPVLPRVTGLRLNMVTGTEDLSRLGTLFPGVRSLTLRLAPDVADVREHVLDLLPCPPVIEKVDGVL
ncbi:hypothetical protein ACFYZJ_34690 [Streptomyces sp. NPDC001848]|uniref:hypothetical protein n=1 Tax=Streptomyces sp. NPDC001848 TaxID=3364618 RepID=UPI00369B26CF